MSPPNLMAGVIGLVVANRHMAARSKKGAVCPRWPQWPQADNVI
jgi:hypothetical protein